MTHSAILIVITPYQSFWRGRSLCESQSDWQHAVYNANIPDAVIFQQLLHTAFELRACGAAIGPKKSINSSMLMGCLKRAAVDHLFGVAVLLRAQTGMYGSHFKAHISPDLQFFCFFLLSTYSNWGFCGEIGPLSTKHDTCVGVCQCAISRNGCNGSKA